MLSGSLQTHSLPALRTSDKVFQALQLMNDYHVTHLPIVDDEKYVGIISEEDLLQADNDNDTLDKFEQSFANTSVKADTHFLTALKVAADNGLSVVPLVNNDNELVGAVAYNDLLKQASTFMSLNEPGGLIVLEIPGNQYSFNEISKLVETNDAQITQLNTNNNPETGTMEVTIRINKPEVSDVVSTFQRYEYNVKYFFGEEVYDNELKSNYENLMNYLRI